MDFLPAGARRARARARRRPRGEPSSTPPRRVDGVSRSSQTLLERLDGLASLLPIIAGGVRVVFTQRMIWIRLPAANVVAREDLIVFPRAMPAQKLRGANRVHRVRSHHGVHDLQNR